MRSRFVPALLALALLALVGRALGAQGRGQDTRPGIAVLPFDNSGSYGQDKENFDALQKGIAGMLISELAANPGARVVERDAIQKLLAQQNLGAADESAGPDGGADVLLEGAPVSGSRAERQGRRDVPAGAGRFPGVYRGAAGPPAREELVT